MKLISADDVIKAVDKHTFETKDGLCLDDDISVILEDVPTIEPEPSQVARDIAAIIENEKDMRVIVERKRGKWIPGRELARTMVGNRTILIKYADWSCSACGAMFEDWQFPHYNFCPNCGADMRNPE